MLFQIDMAGGMPAEIYPHFWLEHEVETEVKEFAQGLVEGVMQRAGRAGRDHRRHRSAHWRVSRMAVVDRNILRVAVYELAWLRETPAGRGPR